MLNSSDTLNKLGSTLVEDIRNALQTKDLTGFGVSIASGDTLQSIRFEVNGNSLLVYGKTSLGSLIYGRKPTQNTGGNLREAIRKWIDDKGTFNDVEDKDSLAYAITKKIHNEGTLLFRQNGGEDSGLLEDVINDNLIEDVKESLKFAFINQLKSDIIKKKPNKK